jgi:N-methylhydantoinase A
MVAQAQDELAAEGIPAARMQFSATLDMRYAGQAYELPVALDGLGSWSAAGLREAFHTAHRQTYGHTLPDRVVEVVTLRLEAIGVVDKPVFEPEPTGSADPSPARVGETVGVFHAGRRTMPLYERDRLAPGMRLDGPALICQMDSTVLLTPRWMARVDGYRNLILERAP